MSQDHYLRMIERMNQNEAKHPPTQAMLNVLKELYTEKQAALIGDFPLGAYSAKDLAEKLGRDEGELKKVLEQMSADGLIFEAKDELDRLIREFDLTHAEAADAVGRSRAAVSNLLRLQELSEKVKPLLEDRQLEMGHARALLGISNATQQYDAARQVIKKGLSVRDTERLVRRMLEGGTKKPATPAASKSADIRRLEIEVSEKLGARVDLQHSNRGAGKLVISYNSLDELDGILKHIK